jgi:hypothetical protein
MADHAALLGASKAQSTLLVLFIPSRDRTEGRQGAVGFVIDRDYLEIAFPLTEGQS